MKEAVLDGLVVGLLIAASLLICMIIVGAWP